MVSENTIDVTETVTRNEVLILVLVEDGLRGVSEYISSLMGK